MRRLSLMPRSLAGQIALLVAVALFVAQAVNFVLLLRERGAYRDALVTVPVVTRIVDATERVVSGRLPEPGERRRGRVRLVDRNPVPAGLRSIPSLEQSIRSALMDGGYPVGAIVAGIRPPDFRSDQDDGPHDRHGGPDLNHRSSEVIVAAQLTGRGWLTLNVRWPMTETNLIAQLFGQTLILYLIIIVPILIVGRRISRPLGDLAVAAGGFTPGGPVSHVEIRGPGDVRSVIAAYNGLSDRVSAMIDEKDRMLGAIGHDLRTPLAALRVRIEDVEDESDRARMAEIIEEMNMTLEDILSLARMGRPSEAVTDVDLGALVDAVVADFDDIGNDVTFEDAPRIPLKLRPTLMRRALRNLIENAVKYAGAAEVRLVASEQDIAIEVADRGPGVPPALLEAVFDPFTRIETSRNRDTGGIGLGLALARAIVRDAGGTIMLANRDGGGLIATIRLPRSG